MDDNSLSENSETSVTPNVEVCDTKTLTEVLEELNIANTHSTHHSDISYSNSDDSCESVTKSKTKNQTQNNTDVEHRTKSGDENVVIARHSTKQIRPSIASNFAKRSKSGKTKSNNSKHMSNWGEMVGIYDSNGHTKRAVSLDELTNYSQLKRKIKSNFKFYVSLIDSRYPRLLRNVEYRWRMRYNMFVSGVIDDNSLLLHIGEIHLYFDVVKQSANPRYINCSFYGNYQPFQCMIDSVRLKQMTHNLKALLTSNDLLQIKFPIADNMFKNCNELYGKFVERQKELMQESMFYFQNEWIPNGKWFNIVSNDAIIANNRSQTLQTSDYQTMRKTIRSAHTIDEQSGDNRTNSGHRTGDNGWKSKRNVVKTTKRFYDRIGGEQYADNKSASSVNLDYEQRYQPSNQNQSNVRYNCNLKLAPNYCECCAMSVRAYQTNGGSGSSGRYEVDQCMAGENGAKCKLNQIRSQKDRSRCASYR